MNKFRTPLQCLFALFFELIDKSRDPRVDSLFVLKWIAIAITVFVLLVFYVRPDILCVSYRIHRVLVERTLTGSTLERGAFVVARLIVWLLVLCWPPTFILFAGQLPLLLRVYLGIILLVGTVLNGGFLFASYDKYICARSQHKWGLLATH